MTAVEENSAERIGQTLRDKWVLEELLGVGGMASVYAARHKIGRRDAIKILHKKVAASEALRLRFEQEAHAVNSFKHPGVVEVRDIDTSEDGAPFLVMELLEGEPLSSRVNREGSMQVRVMLEIAAQVCDVLVAAHERGIIHRDIKPDNIFLSRPEGTPPGPNDPSLVPRVKVLDFGIAKVRSADKRALTTKAGVTLGTMAYMAPEQARGEEIDGRADLYAVGATVFRCLAGRFVHDADSQAALVMKVIAHGAPRLKSVVLDIDPNVAAVVDRALAFEAADRYPDARTMLTDLRAVLAGAPPPYASSAPPLPERPTASSLFDLSDANSKAKPTVVPRKQQSAVSIGAPVTRVAGGGEVDPGAPPDIDAPPPTKLSSESKLAAGIAGSLPTAERVVIVPSRREGMPPTVDMNPGAATGTAPIGEIATVHGLAPPPELLALAQQSPPQTMHASPGPPRAEIETPFAELSAFVKTRTSTLVLVIGIATAVMAVLFVILTLVWLSGSKDSATAKEDEEIPALLPSSAATATTTVDPNPTATAAPAPTTTTAPPPTRRSRRHR